MRCCASKRSVRHLPGRVPAAAMLGWGEGQRLGECGRPEGAPTDLQGLTGTASLPERPARVLIASAIVNCERAVRRVPAPDRAQVRLLDDGSLKPGVSINPELRSRGLSASCRKGSTRVVAVVDAAKQCCARCVRSSADAE